MYFLRLTLVVWTFVFGILENTASVCAQQDAAGDFKSSLREFVGDDLLQSGSQNDSQLENPETHAGMPAYHGKNSKLTLGGYIQPSMVQPGGQAILVLTAVPDSDYHLYPYSDTDNRQQNKPTLIVVTEGFPSQRPQTDAETITPPSGLALSYHPGNVTWTIQIEVPGDAMAGKHRIAGFIGFQTCTDKACYRPEGVAFETELIVGNELPTDRHPIRFQKSSYDLAAAASKDRQEPPSHNLPDDTNFIEVAATSSDSSVKDRSSPSHPVQSHNSLDQDYSLGYILMSAFLGGLILNVMPCVLPVIGLKLMAFVQQAGESRWRVFELNLWYCLGLMSVFMVLAALAVIVGLSWGAHFSSTAFALVILCVVFVFGLALLGVWEIPIPGFIGSGVAVEAAEREGRVGAFFKGALTTILAVPCTGPFMGPALTWAVKQPPMLTYSTFAMLGLGMASPYLLVGIFPKLISFLPKPGAWMNTFKHLMGFVLMGTVVFIFSFLSEEVVIKAMALLVSLGFACWWVGRIPFSATWGRKLRTWTGGAVAVVLTFALMFYVLPMLVLYELDWQPYSRATLDEHLAKGNTVLIDFTADW